MASSPMCLNRRLFLGTPLLAVQSNAAILKTFFRTDRLSTKLSSAMSDRFRMAKSGKNSILYIGLTPGGASEALALGSCGAKVLHVGNSKKPDYVIINGKSYNLSTSMDRQELAGALKFTEYQRKTVRHILKDCNKTSRDEIETLVLRWAIADYGEAIPNRMVISSHSAGAGLFWGKNGKISSIQVKDLAAVFPIAAKAIEHLHLSACYSANGIVDWTSAFPNLQTIWAYSGPAPGNSHGALAHLRIWEKATRGNRMRLHRAAAKDTRRGENVTIWSRIDGLEQKEIQDIETIRVREAASRHIFDEFFTGLKIVVNTGAGPLRDYYDTIQAFLNHPLLQPAERPTLEKKRDTTIRLIFYEKEIRKRFQAAYGTQISAGFRFCGLTIPNFGTLNRKQAMAVILEFKKKVGSNPPAASRECLRLVVGLHDLDTQIIPSDWV